MLLHVDFLAGLDNIELSVINRQAHNVMHDGQGAYTEGALPGSPCVQVR